MSTSEMTGPADAQGVQGGVVLAPHLQGWRLHRGLTSVQLAAQAGVRFATVSRAENGHGLRRQTLDALEAALAVPVEALISDEAPLDATRRPRAVGYLGLIGLAHDDVHHVGGYTDYGGTMALRTTRTA